ncbi:hypothetical protein ACFWHQ_11185, partial [Streptomyces sp. NPDC060334]|uniref:hypothetical protein n=1 Tax=Streptomyces sp. NPDC060334 TaxID=3347099 RepID=UPI0036576E39
RPPARSWTVGGNLLSNTLSDATVYSDPAAAQYGSLFRTARKGESIYIARRAGGTGHANYEAHLRFTRMGRKS